MEGFFEFGFLGLGDVGLWPVWLGIGHRASDLGFRVEGFSDRVPGNPNSSPYRKP